MSLGTIVTFMVVVESVVLFVAVRWLMTGLRSAACREWPQVTSLASSTALPAPRDAALRAEEPAVAAS